MSTDILIDMLSYRRPAHSQTEQDFINKFIMPFKPEIDGFGNLWVEVGVSPILWSSHTDSVHHYGGRQDLTIKEDVVTLTNPKAGTCLGADCATGVWLMAEMIKAEVPGLYIFHREEESGGRGSSFIAKNYATYLDHIRYAIAFDRKATTSVITHQGERTCSDDFADSLISVLGPSFRKDDTGTFTDTANYTDIIGECTNVSVGYYDQHGPKERQDLTFAAHLRDVLIKADFSPLVAKRQPGEEDEDWWFRYSNSYWKNFEPQRKDAGDLDEYVKHHPFIVSSFLEECGYDIKDLLSYEDQMYGDSKVIA